MIKAWQMHKFNKLKKAIVMEPIGSWGDEEMKFTDYFRIEGTVEEFDNDVNVNVYWREPERNHDIVPFNVLINLDQHITHMYTGNHSVNEMIKLVCADAIAAYKQYVTAKGILMASPYLASFNCSSYSGSSGLNVRLKPYDLERYIAAVADEDSTAKRAVKEHPNAIVDYKKSILKEFSTWTTVNADEPNLLFDTFNTWYTNKYLPKLELEARNKECKDTLDAIQRLKDEREAKKKSN
jgi:hypothetical protein